MSNIKVCCVCEQEKPASLEYFHARKGSDDGLRCDCKQCRKDKKLKNYSKDKKKCSSCDEELPNTQEYFNIRNNGVRARTRSICKICHAKQSRANKLLNLYGLTMDDYDKLYNKQNGVCAICEEDKVLVVDHCHDTGKVRSLLCNDCNSGIGFLKENKEIMNKAIKYIDHHGRN